MGTPIATHNKADGVSAGVFLIGLGVLSYFRDWWPGILLVICVSLLVRQLLRGRFYDMGISTLIFGGLFCLFFFNLSWDTIAPVLFTVGGLYIIFREYFVSKERVEVEKIEDAAREIKERDNAERDE